MSMRTFRNISLQAAGASDCAIMSASRSPSGQVPSSVQVPSKSPPHPEKAPQAAVFSEELSPPQPHNINPVIEKVNRAKYAFIVNIPSWKTGNSRTHIHRMQWVSSRPGFDWRASERLEVLSRFEERSREPPEFEDVITYENIRTRSRLRPLHTVSPDFGVGSSR